MADPDKQQAIRDAGDKEALAKQFDGWAGQLDALFTGISTTPKGGIEIWTGPAADRFKGTLKTTTSSITTLAADCRTTAENLRKSAKQLREAVK